MDKKEMKKLERERERLEAARERLEEERERLEEERERMEEERERMEEEMESHNEHMEDEQERIHEAHREAHERHRGEHDEKHVRKRVIVKGDLSPEEQRILDENLKKMDEGLKRMNEELSKMDFSQLKMDKIQEQIDRAQMKIDIAMDGLDEKIENSIAGIDFEKINDTVDKTMKNLDMETVHRGVELHMDHSTNNVGVLNLKDITEEDLEKMGPIKNTGVIIAPEELMSKISSKIIKNIGTVVPYKKGWRIFSGQTEIDSSMLDAIEEPLEFIQTGYMKICDDVTQKQIKAKIKAFHNYGHISATEETYGVLMAKCLENYGQISRNGHDNDDEDDEEDD